MDQPVILLLAILIAALIGYAAWAGEKSRRLALEGLATRLGLGFDPSPDRNLHHEYAHAVFKKGHSRKATNNLWGVMELAGYPVQVRMGDYYYVTGHGKHRTTHRISYAAFHLPFRGLPNLLIRKEHIGDKLIGGIGFDDIDFESEEFSRTFWVKSDDKKFAYDVIHPRMMEFLLGGPTPHVEIANGVCLILEGWGRWDTETFEGAPGWFQEFLQRWPEHLVDKLDTRHGRWP